MNWGSAMMLLDGELREQIIRLGGLPVEPTGQSAIEILTQQIEWPAGYVFVLPKSVFVNCMRGAALLK